MTSQLRANNESYLVSSIYESSKKEDRQVNPYHYKFDRSIVPHAIEHDTEVVFSNPKFNATTRVELPRSGFSFSGFVKLEVSITGGAAATISDLLSATHRHTNLGFLNCVDEITLETRKEVLYRMKQKAIYDWIESLDEESRNAYKLLCLQGVTDEIGTAFGGTDISGATKTVYFYLPLQMFPPFSNPRQSMHLGFVEPIQVVLKLDSKSSLVGASKLVSNLTEETTSVVSAVLNTSHAILDSDAENAVLQRYAAESKLQMITHDRYECANTVEAVSANFKDMKLEGLKNVVRMSVIAINSDGKVVPIKAVKLTDGNKTMFNYTGVESRVLAFHGLKPNMYKENNIVHLDFALTDEHELVGESYSGSLSVENMIDPRLHVMSSENATVYVVGTQLSTIHINTASGAVLLGSSS